MLGQPITMSEKVIMWFKRMRTTKQSSFLHDAKEQFNGEDDSARISVVQSEPDPLTLIRWFLKGKGIDIASSTSATHAYNKFQKENKLNKPNEM